MKTAVKPDYFNLSSFIREKDIFEKRGINQDEQDFYKMSQTNGWEKFKELAGTLLKELDDLNDNAVAKGQSYEELGKNAVVISLTRGIIKRLLDRVEDSKEACEPRGDK